MNDLRDYLTAPAPPEPRQPEPVEPVQFTSTTPSGIEVLYQASPKRLYKVRQPDVKIKTAGGEFESIHRDWREVPSVTTVLGVLDKSGALTWWGQGIGVEGTIDLVNRGHLIWLASLLAHADGTPATKETVVALLTEHRKTVNHVRDRAGDRGTSVHKALEDWADNGTIPDPSQFPDSERGYVEGVRRFLADLCVAEVDDVQSEVMVGSVEHGYAGRYDLRLYFGGGNLVTKHYPKKTDRVEEIPAGRLLLDLKTSSGVYPSHFMQLEAYEEASRECGYEDTDRRAVVRVSDDGFYEFVTSPATFDDFLAVKSTYDALARIKGKK